MAVGCAVMAAMGEKWNRHGNFRARYVKEEAIRRRHFFYRQISDEKLQPLEVIAKIINIRLAGNTSANMTPRQANGHHRCQHDLQYIGRGIKAI